MHVALAGLAAPYNLASGVDAPRGMAHTPVNELCLALLERGHRVSLVTVDPDLDRVVWIEQGALTIACTPYRRRARTRAADVFSVERAHIAGALAHVSDRYGRPDVIHAHWTYEFALASLSAGAPLVITAHDSPFTVLRHQPTLYRILRLAMAAAVRLRLGPRAHLTAVSPYLAAKWRRHFAVRQPIPVVPNIAPHLTNAATTTPVGGDILLSLGDNSPLKNMLTALEAYRLLRQSGEGLPLHLAGNGLDSTGEFASMARARGLATGVVFDGFLDRGTLAARFAAARLLVHPSLEESQPVALIEALRLGVPVVAGRDSGGVGWTLDHGRAGLLVDVTDAASICDGMRRLLQAPTMRATYASQGRALVENRYSALKVATQYEDLYTAAILSFDHASRA